MADIMGKMDIAFPNLHIYLSNVPKSISVFGFEIAFYGMIIALGVFLGFMLASKEGKRLGQPDDLWWDFIVWAIVFSVIGARLYYVIFSWDMYKDNPMQIFNIRNGGLAIYGAVIGGILTLYVFSRIKKQSFLSMADAGVFGLLLGQIIGRWGNFMNRECFGGYTDGLFAMRLPIEMVRSSDISPNIAAHIVEGTNYIQVHPTFLYESGLNLILLLVMWAYRKHKKFDGEMILWYLGGYGIIRFFVEGLRTDQLQIGQTGIAVSQMLGGGLFAASLIILIVMHIRLHKREKLQLTEGKSEKEAEEIDTESKNN
ncbi:MAG: prolipoprotein diacylglyceryl transferase [Lachnospiraceae bacterium]